MCPRLIFPSRPGTRGEDVEGGEHKPGIVSNLELLLLEIDEVIASILIRLHNMGLHI